MEWCKTLLEMASSCTDLAHKLNIEDKTKTLKRKMETLVSRMADIRAQLDIEEKRPGKKRKEEVKDWLKNFERLSHEVNDIGQKVAMSASFWQLTLGSHLDKLIKGAEQLHEQGRFSEGLTLDMDETRGYELPVGKLVGRAFQSSLEEIWNYLMSEEVQIIGVQGMGGVGKTTLVTQIHNQIVNDLVTFQGSCWVTVSQDCSIRKLQDAIAKHFLLDLENEIDEKIRAGKLWTTLRSRKFIIILDDLWEYYPLEKVGIPLEKNGCKLILTSRKNDICSQMNCDKLVKVATLPEQEAWYLFQDNLRCGGSPLSPGVEEIAQLVAKECAGLPLGIVVLSGIMKGVNDIYEWRNTLKELQESKFKVERMEDEVFKVLRFSYQRLNDSTTQQFFLHIALYPEDATIYDDEVIQYFIDIGMIERGATRRAQFDKGSAILNKLVKSCLLQEREVVELKRGIRRDDPRKVQMHDLVRDMGIDIINDHCMVKAGQRLIEIPDMRDWLESLEKISFMSNDIKEIPPDASPRCPRLLALFLQKNPLVSIPNSFFWHMHALEILNLSQTSIEQLPDSFTDLENLKALHLDECFNLRSLPSLAKMTVLTTLNLYRSGIEKIPHGMERLRSLTYLDLGETKQLNGMQWPTGILPQLLHLQCLNFNEGPKIMKAKELMSLRKLERLHCWFDDAYEFSTCMRYLQSRTLQFNHWDINLGASGLRSFSNDRKMVTIRKFNMEGRGESFRLADDMNDLYLTNCQGLTSLNQLQTIFPELKVCGINGCNGMEMVINDSQQSIVFPKLRELRLFNLRDLRVVMSSSLQSAMKLGNHSFFSSLTVLEIFDCPRIKKLLTLPLLPLLTHLESIRVCGCEELEEIIAIEDSDHDAPILDLPKLSRINVQNLPQLKSICGVKWTMKCDSLETLFISECPRLERIPTEIHIPRIQEEAPVPSSLKCVFFSSIPAWSDTRWQRREGGGGEGTAT